MTKVEDESRVKEVIELSEQVLTHTAISGKEVIVRDKDALNAKWQAYNASLTKVSIAVDLYCCVV